MPHIKIHTLEEATAIMHRARTELPSARLRARAYSHRWLVERELPSGLPDWLKERAERLCPIKKKFVGVMVKSAYPEVGRRVMRAMSDAVEEVHADGVDLESPLVGVKMFEARERELRGLGMLKKYG